MKFFVSGKAGSDEQVREVMKLLQESGHEITFDWTTIPHLRPYDLNPNACRKAALLESRGVKDADVVVLVAHPQGIGMFVELGIAIGAGIPVRVITNEDSRTMFFHHPLVTRVKDVFSIVEEFS